MESLFYLPPLFLVLYAEVHYTFPLGLSLIRRDFPEMVADLPWRIDPGHPLPILCLVKDAHQYPVRLNEITVTIRWKGRGLWRKTYPLHGKIIDERLWYHILEIPRGQLPDGPVVTDVLLTGHHGNRPFRFHNDNYRGLSHRPLSTILASEPLPGLPGWYPGDPHVHSSYTEDQVEFGAPPEVTVAMARSMGLRWTAITDHSYDLDDLPGNPLAPDPTLRKWHRLKDIVLQLNSRYADFITLLGEEVSCGNARGRNVHLLAFEVPSFIPGNGDSAEHWLRNAPTWPIPQVLDYIRSYSGVAYAAHPEESGSPLERILLRRGSWTHPDYVQTGLSGMQIWNGRRDGGLRRGRDRWIQLLLEGQELALIGGTDAHGNFNRFRQLRLPFVSLRESTEQVFGTVRTYLHCPGRFDRNQSLAALSRGSAVITNGPLVTFAVTNQDGQLANIGEHLVARTLVVEISARSSTEFGALERIDVFQGRVGQEEKRIRFFRRGRDFGDSRRADIRMPLCVQEQKFYLRVEAKSALGGKTWLAMTNPIWLNDVSRAKTDAEHRE